MNDEYVVVVAAVHLDPLICYSSHLASALFRTQKNHSLNSGFDETLKSSVADFSLFAPFDSADASRNG